MDEAWFGMMMTLMGALFLFAAAALGNAVAPTYQQAVERGWLEVDGKTYLVTPARLELTPST